MLYHMCYHHLPCRYNSAITMCSSMGNGGLVFSGHVCPFKSKSLLIYLDTQEQRPLHLQLLDYALPDHLKSRPSARGVRVGFVRQMPIDITQGGGAYERRGLLRSRLPTWIVLKSFRRNFISLNSMKKYTFFLTVILGPGAFILPCGPLCWNYYGRINLTGSSYALSWSIPAALFRRCPVVLCNVRIYHWNLLLG